MSVQYQTFDVYTSAIIPLMPSGIVNRESPYIESPDKPWITKCGITQYVWDETVIAGDTFNIDSGRAGKPWFRKVNDPTYDETYLNVTACGEDPELAVMANRARPLTNPNHAAGGITGTCNPVEELNCGKNAGSGFHSFAYLAVFEAYCPGSTDRRHPDFPFAYEFFTSLRNQPIASTRAKTQGAHPGYDYRFRTQSNPNVEDIFGLFDPNITLDKWCRDVLYCPDGSLIAQFLEDNDCRCYVCNTAA